MYTVAYMYLEKCPPPKARTNPRITGVAKADGFCCKNATWGFLVVWGGLLNGSRSPVSELLSIPKPETLNRLMRALEVLSLGQTGPPNLTGEAVGQAGLLDSSGL